MLHEVIFSATCKATMTTETLQVAKGVSYARNFCSQPATRPLNIINFSGNHYRSYGGHIRLDTYPSSCFFLISLTIDVLKYEFSSRRSDHVSRQALSSLGFSAGLFFWQFVKGIPQEGQFLVIFEEFSFFLCRLISFLSAAFHDLLFHFHCLRNSLPLPSD